MILERLLTLNDGVKRSENAVGQIGRIAIFEKEALKNFVFSIKFTNFVGCKRETMIGNGRLTSL